MAIVTHNHLRDLIQGHSLDSKHIALTLLEFEVAYRIEKDAFSGIAALADELHKDVRFGVRTGFISSVDFNDVWHHCLR